MDSKEIMHLVKQRRNIIFYDRDVLPCFKLLEDKYLCINFNEPTPARIRLIKMIKIINPDCKINTSHITVVELEESIVKELGYTNLIIIFNHFEKLTKRNVGAYEYLNNVPNIQFICSFNKKINKNVYPFFKTFKHLNKKEYKDKISKKEINITYPLYIFLSIICFYIYVKSANSVYMAAVLLGGAWFSIIIFRTLMYAGGRV